ncbi:hypothetical protein [Gloeobacter kilaueensis]|uniref:Uncharacterized protein n=1 Tax=Gloeobacter kilaueensis (strain ATCC BAA-2537 / CCAP 1431/1 / ULC 316 / JS1) TaxID=1183438 RepID=U5QHY7_GLOK1|nr:hypothetical protein [Gloeobacter kilaueensis]AGY57275.1 hypothetical protein GKIL_1029 [Gloeobacter kilaueensis JS1]
MSTKLDTTLAAFQEKITSLTVGKATRNIEAWRKDLAEAGPDYEPIAADLEKLEGILKSDEVDGKAVGKLLARLGKETKKVAAKIDSSTSEKLEKLSELLTKSSKEDFAA